MLDYLSLNLVDVRISIYQPIEQNQKHPNEKINKPIYKWIHFKFNTCSMKKRLEVGKNKNNKYGSKPFFGEIKIRTRQLYLPIWLSLFINKIKISDHELKSHKNSN